MPQHRLSALRLAFEATFAIPLAMARDRFDMDVGRLEAQSERTRERQGREAEVPGTIIWMGLVRQEVTTFHIRLLLAFLGHRELVMVRRGYATRRGSREDYAWAEFNSLAEARRVRYLYDGIR